jgi:hypothetical protein
MNGMAMATLSWQPQCVLVNMASDSLQNTHLVLRVTPPLCPILTNNEWTDSYDEK